ncbi:MAG: hypothetical protein CMJ64_15385 [Planctomycetaceae bacterium]|nr:hypothetical protein [Planctomycetaceae bacterium]
MIAVARKSEELKTATWQEGFLEMMPMIEQQARVAFRDLDAEAREDAIAEVTANAMVAYERLHERGELQRAFASALAKYAIRQFFDGRRTGTPQCSRDVYSARAKKTVGYEVLSLGAPGEQVGEWMECLINNRQTPVPDQVAFRMDFPRWLDNQTPRDKRVAQRLSLGYSTGEVAKEFSISPARVSQLRRELADSWHEFISAALGQANDEESGEE